MRWYYVESETPRTAAIIQRLGNMKNVADFSQRFFTNQARCSMIFWTSSMFQTSVTLYIWYMSSVVAPSSWVVSQTLSSVNTSFMLQRLLFLLLLYLYQPH